MKENKNRMIDRQIKVTIPLLNLVSLANHDMRKTWCMFVVYMEGCLEKLREFKSPLKVWNELFERSEL